MKRHNDLMQITVHLTVLVCSIIALGGCGFKDDPVPPNTVVPTAITDLRYQLSDKGVTLYWSYPGETVSGDELPDISEFFMYRAVVPVDSYCDTCPIPFGNPISLPGGSLPRDGQKTASYQATLLRPGNLYFFKVRSKASWWAESDDSNVIQFLWNTPAQAPTGLTITADENKNILQWQPVKTHLDGSPITAPVKYQVFRSTAGTTFEPLGNPVAELSYTDMSVVTKRKYFYQVQSISLYPQGSVGGGVSETVSASPMDKTPPATPAGLRGIYTSVGIKVFWEHVKAPDVKGYRVYRRLSGEQAPTMVAEVLLPYNMYIDRNPPKDKTKIYYSVTSIDTWTPPNESPSSPEIMVKN